MSYLLPRDHSYKLTEICSDYDDLYRFVEIFMEAESILSHHAGQVGQKESLETRVLAAGSPCVPSMPVIPLHH